MRDDSFLTLDQQLTGDAYSSFEAMDNLTTLCDEFGSRFGGTEGEKQAADFIAQKLKSYGLQNVALEPFEYLAWSRGSASLEITHPIRKTIDCISLPHSPATDMTAELYDAGDGAVAHFETHANAMKNKIVIASSETFPKGAKRWVHRSEKYGRSLLNGASAFIFMNHYAAYGPATGGIGRNNQLGLIPAISVSYEDGSFLRRLVKKHGKVTLNIKTTDSSERKTSWNVLADLTGSKHPEQVIMLGSHYDGHDISQGAQDPASGTVAVMEVARLLAKHAKALPYTIRFALWGVEEIGLLGSKYHVQNHKDSLDDLKFYFNMDSAGSTPNKGVVLNEWLDLETQINAWQDAISFPFKTMQSVNAFSDHYPFLLEGVPTGGLESVPKGTSGRGYGHTKHDTLDKVTVRELQDAAVLASILVTRLATLEPDNWPAKRRSQEAVNALLDRPEYTETAEINAKIAELYKN